MSRLLVLKCYSQVFNLLFLNSIAKFVFFSDNKSGGNDTELTIDDGTLEMTISFTTLALSLIMNLWYSKGQ